MSNPTAHHLGSFGYKVFDRQIKRALKMRSELDNTIQVAMPFVKATATIEMPEYLGDGNIGFTLGLHAINQDVEMEDMYSANDQFGYPLIGYTYTANGTNQKIYSNPPEENTQRINMFLNQGLSAATVPELAESGHSFSRIAPPGIINATIGRNKNGLLVAAELQIKVPSIMQLEALHRTFLIPGVGMIIEWGQQYAPQQKSIYGQEGLGTNLKVEQTQTSLQEYMFPWYRPEEAKALLKRLAQRKVGMDEILQKYVRPTQGQYAWMFGRVANFSVKGTADGSYDVSVKIVGPSEDAWAYTTKNTITRGIKLEDKTTFCAGTINTISEYFNKRSAGGFEALLVSVINGEAHQDWASHVFKIQGGNQQPGAPPSGSKTSLSDWLPWSSDPRNSAFDITAFKDVPDAYYISWRFFVNVVLNGGVPPDASTSPAVNSLLRMFQDNLSAEQYQRITLIRPYTTNNGNVATAPVLNDPYENRVGANRFLRSIDVSRVLIANPLTTAEGVEFRNVESQSPVIAESWNHDVAATFGGGQLSSIEGTFRTVGRFLDPAQAPPPAKAEADAVEEERESDSELYLPEILGKIKPAVSDGSRVAGTVPGGGTREIPVPFLVGGPPLVGDFGYLSSGVWLNHLTIIEAMASAETFLQGMTNLLQRMSSATNGYWSLTLDPVEAFKDSTHTYTIVDTNYLPRSEEAVALAIGNTDTEDEIEEPNRLYTFNKYVRKTKTGALVGSELLESSIDLSLPKRLFAQIAAGGLIRPEDKKYLNLGNDTVPSSLVSEPNEATRLMYAISTISTKLFTSAGGPKSPDLTALDFGPTRTGGCTGESSAEYGNAATQGFVNRFIPAVPADYAGRQEQLDRAQKKLEDPICQACKSAQCVPAPELSSRPTSIQLSGGSVALNNFLSQEGVKEALASVSQELGVNPANLLKVMVAESSLKSTVVNGIGCGGLFQFCNGQNNELINSLKTKGTPLGFEDKFNSGADIAKNLTAAEQIKLAGKMFKNMGAVGKMISAGWAYAYNYLPGRASMAKGNSDYALTQVGEPYYDQNKSLDVNKDGRITVNDLESRVQQLSTSFRIPDNISLIEQPANAAPTPATSTTQTNLIGDRLKRCNPNNLPKMQTRGTISSAIGSVAGDQFPNVELITESNLPSGFRTSGPPTTGGQFGVSSLTNPTPTLLSARDVMSVCDQCFEAEVFKAKIEAAQNEKGGSVTKALVDELKDRNRTLSQLINKYQEYNPSFMFSLIRGTADDSKSNALGTAPGSLSLSADLVLPGISGLRVGELFWIDRIPAMYKIFGAFQIMSIEDTISTEGWKTSIHARFNYLGKEWREKVLQILTKQGVTI